MSAPEQTVVAILIIGIIFGLLSHNLYVGGDPRNLARDSRQNTT